MADPETLLDQPVPRRVLCAWIFSSEYVRDGITQEARLRYVLSVLVARHRKSNHPPPYFIVIVNGAIERRPNPHAERYWEEKQEEAGQGVAYMSPIQQADIARESGDIEAQTQEAEARSRSFRERIDDHETRQDEARSTGTEPGPQTLQYARPRCPKRPGLPWLLILGCLAIVFLGMFEDFMLTWPILDRWGIDSSRLDMEWQTQPLTVIGGVSTAITATACLLFGWHILVSWAVALSTKWETQSLIGSAAKLVGLVAFSVCLFLFSLCIANLRHDNAVSASTFQGAASGQSASSTDTSLFLWLTFFMPAGAAYIQFHVSKSPYWQARADFRKQQALHAKAENQFQLTPAIRHDVLDGLRAKLAQCEQEKSALEERRKALSARVDGYRNAYLKRLKDERSAVETFSSTLVSALQTECYFFGRAANRAHATHLLTRGPICLFPESTGDSPAGGGGAPSRPGMDPHYQTVRPLLPGRGHPRQGEEI